MGHLYHPIGWQDPTKNKEAKPEQPIPSSRTELDLRGLFSTKEELKAWVLTHTDQTTLEPTLTKEQLSKFVVQSGEAGFSHICIPLVWAREASGIIFKRGFKMTVAVVVGFPHGNELSTEGKVSQIIEAGQHNVDEIDFVTNISLFRSDREAFRRELTAIVREARIHYMRTKMIFEAYYLSDIEICDMAVAAQRAGVDIVKTSTGFAVKGKNHPGRDPEEIGATASEIEMMGAGVMDKRIVGIKPSGGIRTLDKLLGILVACKAAGWELDMVRIGTSSGIQFLEALQ